MAKKLFRFKVPPLTAELAVIETAPGEFNTEPSRWEDRLDDFPGGCNALSMTAQYADREIAVRRLLSTPVAPLDEIEIRTLGEIADLYAKVKRHYLTEAVAYWRVRHPEQGVS